MSSLSDEIRDILRRSGCELSAAEIRRRIKGAVDASEVACRLSHAERRGLIRARKGPRQAITGPKEIKLYQLAEDEENAA